MTPSLFRTLYPEFAKAPSETAIQHAIDTAAASLNRGAFGDEWEKAVGLKAAHYLSLTPHGQQSRLVMKTGETTYSIEFAAMVRRIAAGTALVARRS